MKNIVIVTSIHNDDVAETAAIDVDLLNPNEKNLVLSEINNDTITQYLVVYGNAEEIIYKSQIANPVGKFNLLGMITIYE